MKKQFDTMRVRTTWTPHVHSLYVPGHHMSIACMTWVPYVHSLCVPGHHMSTVCMYLDTTCPQLVCTWTLTTWFHFFQDLLQDSAVVVRVMAIHGVCKVISAFWEMIPAIVIKTFLQELVENLAWDTASIDVRVAVLQVCVYVQHVHVYTYVCMCV